MLRRVTLWYVVLRFAATRRDVTCCCALLQSTAQKWISMERAAAGEGGRGKDERVSPYRLNINSLAAIDGLCAMANQRTAGQRKKGVILAARHARLADAVCSFCFGLSVVRGPPMAQLSIASII